MIHQMNKIFQDKDPTVWNLAFQLMKDFDDVVPDDVEEVKLLIQKRITKQVERLFQSLEAQRGKYCDNIAHMHTQANNISFRLIVKPSIIPESGNGLHLEGEVPPGTVVALYKGTVFSSEDMMLVNTLYPQLFTQNDYIISRSDGILLDGKDSDPSKRIFELCMDKEISAKNNPRKERISNDFATAQYINHSKTANVIPIDYNFPSDFPSCLCKYIPNVQFLSHSLDNNVLIRGMVMLSLRQINNEELLLDYRYNPKNLKIPNWYKSH